VTPNHPVPHLPDPPNQHHQPQSLPLSRFKTGSDATTTSNAPTEESGTRSPPSATSPAPQPNPALTPPSYPPHALVRKVSAAGCIGYRNYLIGLGVRWYGARVMLTDLDRVTHIYLGDTLIRSLVIDPNRYHQPMERLSRVLLK
jgi:hypothetical protein